MRRIILFLTLLTTLGLLVTGVIASPSPFLESTSQGDGPNGGFIGPGGDDTEPEPQIQCHIKIQKKIDKLEKLLEETDNPKRIIKIQKKLNKLYSKCNLGLRI